MLGLYVSCTTNRIFVYLTVTVYYDSRYWPACDCLIYNQLMYTLVGI